MAERFYLSLLGESYEDRGVRLYDNAVLYPAKGRKKIISLTRKSYDIISSKEERLLIDNGVIRLPSMINEKFHFILRLCGPSKKSHDEPRLRYLLKSKTNTPFRHNNSLVYEAFVERGDVVNFGYNKFKFDFNFIQYDCRPSLDMCFVKSKLSILIEGETGTGKTTLARKIHEESGRWGRFVHLNLSSFSSQLIESELFGHIKGAFTGALKNKRGAFLEANGGTLFIDEVDSLSLGIQTKLLLFLDSGIIRPVGSSQEVKVDVRLIVASGSDLRKEVQKREVRKDFYYRVSSGVKVVIEPLRANKKKTMAILNDFMQMEEVYFDAKLIRFYLNHNWPGNVRQLIGHLEKKKVFSKGSKLSYDEVDEHLGSENLKEDEYVADVISMKELKSKYAHKVLLKFGGNIKSAAHAIGVTPQTLMSLTASQK